MDVVNSAYDAIGILPVADILDSPELVEDAVKELIEGEQAYKLFFDTFTTDNPTIAYRYDTATGLDDELAEVPEFSNIPVSDPQAPGPYKYVPVEKHALAIRVSEEQRMYNLHQDVQREVRALAQTIRRSNTKAALTAIDEAEGVETYNVAHAWDTKDGDPYTDLNLVIEMIMGAVDSHGKQFDYEPDLLWANPVTINLMKRNKTMQDLYIGDMAHANPVFKPIEREPLLGDTIQIVPDRSIPKGTAYIGVEGTAGFEAQAAAPSQTPWYEEGGQSGKGGHNMTWRSDYAHFRCLGVRAPKSIVKITGLVTA